ncbi:MAG TPA: 16S rRNA (guanine(527)-N(7))-methyltransferase RsmG [Solirubrobacteraceae bacterium]
MSEVSDRVAGLCARFDLTPEAGDAFERLLDLVAGEPVALTSVRDPRQAVDVHLADSLAGLLLPVVCETPDLADLGSGGGYPGLVLAVARPTARVVLVESVGKKAAFLRRAADQLGLASVEVVDRRVEDWAAGRDSVGLVTARALARLPVVLEYAAPLLRLGGSVVAWKGRRDAAEEAAGASAAVALGLSPPEPVAVPADLVAGADARHLYVSLKVEATPPRYPRRAGMARKRPLGPSSGA